MCIGGVGDREGGRAWCAGAGLGVGKGVELGVQGRGGG